MRPARQPLWKLDTMFLALATAALIFSWMAQQADDGSAGKPVAQLSSLPAAQR